MIRLTHTSSGWYGFELGGLLTFWMEKDAENIEELVTSGDTVVLSESLETACEHLGIDEDEVTMVKGK